MTTLTGVIETGRTLRYANDFARLYAFRANAEFDGPTVDTRAHRLQIRQPSSLCARSAKSPRSGMDVSNVLPKLGTFAAYITDAGHCSM